MSDENSNHPGNQQRYTFSSPSINNIIEAAGYGHIEADLNDAALMDQHTGWTPLIKQSIANSSNNNNINSDEANTQINELFARSNSLGSQYQQIMLNQFSSPSKIDANNLNIERLLATEGEFLDSNNNFSLLLSATPMNSRTNGYLLHDLFMDTPNLSTSNNDSKNNNNNSNSSNSNNNNNNMLESPTKLMQQNMLFSAQRKRLTPYRLHQQSAPVLYPETPGTKFVRSLLELPLGATPLPPPSLPRTNKGSPLKDSISSATNLTPLTKKSKAVKRKIQEYETPKKKQKRRANMPPNDNGEFAGSSPSTIKVTSISPTSKMKGKSSAQLSPTPASQKGSISSQSFSSQTPNLQPPPIGTFKKEESNSQSSSSTVSQQAIASAANGKGPKFQIIFQDVDSLMKKSLLKNKKARSKSGILAANNSKKNRLSRSVTYAGIDSKLQRAAPKIAESQQDKENQFTSFSQPKSYSQSSQQYQPEEMDIRGSVINHIDNGLHDHLK